MKRVMAYLKILSWNGYGGEHYFGEVRYEDCETPTWQIIHPMSSKEAKYLNKKDGMSHICQYKPGDMTERFETEKELVAFTVKEFKKLHPDGILIKGSNCSASPHEIVYAPEKFRDKVESMNKMAKEFEDLFYEPNRVRSFPKNQQRADELEKDWNVLLGSF